MDLSYYGAYATGRLEHSGRYNDEKVSRKNAQSHATFFRHSAVLSLPAVLLRKLPIVRIVFEFRVIAFGGWRT